MENNANYALVGVLAAAALVALFAFVYWFVAPAANIALKPYDIVFTGTVSGIARGTDVTFNGIRIGRVNTVQLDPEDSNRVVASVEVDATVPVRRYQGGHRLSGSDRRRLGAVERRHTGRRRPANRSGPHSAHPLRPVSDFQSIIDGLSSTVNGASTAVSRINTLLDANDDKINTTLANIESFSTAPAANSDGVEAAPASISEAGKQIGPMAEQIGDLSAKVSAPVEAVPPEDVAKVVADVTVFSDSSARNSDQIDKFFATTSVLSDNLTQLTEGLHSAVAVIDQVAAEIDPAIVGRVLDNVDKFATSLGNNTDNVDTIVANVTSVTDQLTRSVEKVDSILARVDSSVSSVEGQGLFNDIARAAQSVRAPADQLNASTSRIASGLNDFTSRGLSEYTALAVDARGTLQRLDRVVRNLENNPQGLIFGGETVRDYTKQ
ncbi:MlaD family protein [Devosia sp. A8/3-2]|nr:MlaD family protein [Devosia sp. A8/3-2]